MRNIEETLYKVVEEAVRKVLAAQKKKKVLLLLRDGTDKESLVSLLGELKKIYQVDVLSFLLKDLYLLEKEEMRSLQRVGSSILKEESYEALLQGYEGMILSEAGPEELKGYKDLRFEGSWGRLVYTSLKEEKPVYAFSYDLSTMKNQVLKKRFEEMLPELSAMKLHVLPLWSRTTGSQKHKGTCPQTVKGPEKIPEGSFQNEGTFLEKFITLSDLLSLGEGQKTLWVRPDAVLTDAAEEYRRRRGITLHRKIK